MHHWQVFHQSTVSIRHSLHRQSICYSEHRDIFRSVIDSYHSHRYFPIGVFAVASMMVGTVRLRYIPDDDDGGIHNGSLFENEENYFADIAPITLTAALTLAVGIVQVVVL